MVLELPLGCLYQPWLLGLLVSALPVMWLIEDRPVTCHFPAHLHADDVNCAGINIHSCISASC